MEAKDKEEPKIGWLTQTICTVIIGTYLFSLVFLYLDVQTYTAPGLGILIPIFMLLSALLGLKISFVIPKDKREHKIWSPFLFMAAFLLPQYIFPTLFWINYKWSDPESRHEEIITIEKYGRSGLSNYYMFVRFEDGCQRNIDIKKEQDGQYKEGTTLPVTLERGLFGIDVIVEWGFENDEHTILLPNSKYKER